jgi:hypothetical protein
MRSDLEVCSVQKLKESFPDCPKTARAVKTRRIEFRAGLLATTRATFVITSWLLIAGCAQYQIVTSEPTAGPPPKLDSAEPGGLVYSLPQTLVQVTATQDSDTRVVTYTVTASTLPDPRAKFRLRFSPSGETDNTLDLKVDSNGLLTSTTANITDRTGDIVVAIASTIAAAARLPLSAPQGLPPPVAPAPSIYPFTEYFALDELLTEKTLNDNARIKIEKLNDSGAVKPPDQSCTYSICYRSLIPVVGTIISGAYRTQFYFPAIDTSRTEGISLKSAALVARTNTVEFSNGIATHVAISQPSTNLALASLPLTVVKAIMTSLFTLNISYINDQQALLQAQTALLTAAQNLQNAKATPSPPPK